ncbi:hypothetical protein FA13DRAFT_1815271 [Coprinellus micaceus]|uniref:Transcription elongation factor Eaf N-terminal domain-containing protein n=1 Tax=Coprinellus micaceus TaxID=71717 RepID=A0A4Y7T7F0_COPMI|nr:hypothetical protein FA13DRAFT_1815271 [Coprinellus micaceus]
MANVNTAWMPTKGKHRVEIGSSLARCLKSRKKSNGEATTTGKRSHLPDKDFYSFRYNHKPSSLDSKKQGMIQFEQGGAAPVILEHPSVQSGESTMYRGREAELRAYDCVLIIDEDTGTFTLEKLDACIQLTSDRGLSSIMPRTDSPTPSNSTPRGSSNDPTRDPIDQDILDLEGSSPAKEEEEEEGDDDDFPAPARPPSQPKQQPVAAMPVPSASSRPSKPIPKARPKASPPQAPVSRSEIPPPRKSPPKQQPKYDQDDNIGELDVALIKVAPAPSKPKFPAKPVQLPAKPALAPAKPQAHTKPTGLALPIKSSVPRPGSKKQSAAPTPAPPSQPVAPAPLALPGSSTAQAIRLPSSLPKPAPAPAAPVHEILEDSDEEDNEDNWEEVTTAAEPGPPPETSLSKQVDQEMEDIFGGEDEDDFGQQLELEMELADGLGDTLEEEDDEDYDMEPVPLPDGDGPISLNALAGGGAFNPGGLSDDDYSSSDDSDDY